MTMSKQPWALILGASSGFGEATALELARAGMNIFGVHLDRRDKLPHVEEIQDQIRALGREAEFFNCNASDDEMRADIMEKIREAPGRAARHAARADALAGLGRAQAAGRRRAGGLARSRSRSPPTPWATRWSIGCRTACARACSSAARAFSP